MSTVYETFAARYIDRFMEGMVLGISGGLYREEILANEGRFGAGDIVKFIRFQHGDNDYHYEFGKISDQELQSQVKETARALLALVDSDWYAKEHYTSVCPGLIFNVRGSLENIIEG